MTFGAGGGSPISIQKVNFTFSSGVETIVYTCPINTLAIIDPVLQVNSGGAPSAAGGFFRIKNNNPSTGSPFDELLVFDSQGGLYMHCVIYTNTNYVQFSNSVTLTPGLYARLQRFEKVESVTVNNGSASQGFWTFGSGLILFPGESLSYAGALAGNKLQYQLREFGIAS